MRKRKYLMYIICLSVLIQGGSDLQPAHKSLTKMENKITLVPVGNVEEWILDELASQLKEVFNCEAEIGKGTKIPQGAYNSRRNQCFSSFILNKLRRSTKPAKSQRILAIADVDLYVEGLNFVFGEAELGGHFAIISLSRLRQSFYGMPENKELFTERAVKEAVHELGHVYGLRHCPDSSCVMHFSNSLMDTDKKSTTFCARCEEKLEKIQKH